jgi:hypothetical protein
MKAPWSRRVQETRGAGVTTSERKSRWNWRVFLPSKASVSHAHGPLLRLARDYLIASGGQLHAEAASRIVADLPDGRHIAYTDAPGHAEDGALLLVPGSAAATEMIAEIETRSRFGALRLTSVIDALTFAAGFSAPATEKKRRSEAGADGSRQGGRLILHWEKAPARTAVSRSWESTRVEIEYRVVGRDHSGRIEDTLRIVVDPSGDAKSAALDLSRAGAMQSTPLTSTDRDLLKTVLGQIDRRLQPQVEAAASFLRLRSASEYRWRIETAQGIAERARREQPAEAPQTEQALKQELAALGAVFAVEVEATVAAVWVIRSPMAGVTYHLTGGSTVEVALDLGRGTAESLTCASCQRATHEAIICVHAHILCAVCRDLTARECVICAEPSTSAGQSGLRQAPRATRKDSSTGSSSALTLEGFAGLGPEMWRASVVWLLERQDYTLGALDRKSESPCWRGVDAAGEALFIRALKGDPAQVISERDVVETARLAREQRLERALLLSAGAPTRAARELAESSSVRIVDGDVLSAQLATLAGSAERQQATVQAEAKARARAAINAHAAMQRALAAATKRVEAKSPKPRATGNAALATTRDQLRATRTSADQAFLAWETLLADWLAAFESAPAHDGTLPILLEASAFTLLRERATHLGSVLSNLLRELIATPSDGELGYSVWRAAVVEEARLRCAALAALLQSIDPAQWADYDAARSQARETDALEAEVAARRASARADKAQSRVTQLAG